MKLKKLLDTILQPCNKCPYKLGIIKSVENPCPQCKLNGYNTYYMLKKKL